jgi:hypothetical protein
MTQSTTYEEVRAIRADRQHVAALLDRYPRVSEDETQEIITFLRTGRHLDVGMVTGDDALRPKLDAFMADHKKHFRLKWTEIVAAVTGIFGIPTGAWLLWEAFA